MSTQDTTTPRASLSIGDGIAMMVGLIIGVGIFKLPQLVALNADSGAAFLGLWVLGGVITLIGAMVYAELAAAYPSTGGEYHFLTRALGRDVGLLFAWARTTVIQTGAIAAVSFVFGDYAQQLWPLGTYGGSIYAAAALIFITLINLAGTYQSKNAQIVFTVLEVGAVVFIAFVGLVLASPAASAAVVPSAGSTSVGLAIVFILFTYGGWNEAAYLSQGCARRAPRHGAHPGVRDARRYAALSPDQRRVSERSRARWHAQEQHDRRRRDARRARPCGRRSAQPVRLLRGVEHDQRQHLHRRAGLSRARRGFVGALAEPVERTGNNPRNAIYLQSAIALALIGFGATTREGFQAMVEYTAPVFWFFLFLVGVSAFVLRHREPERERPFRMPLYPVTPALFCLTCLYLLYSSIAYTGLGSLVGVGVLLVGVAAAAGGSRKRRYHVKGTMQDGRRGGPQRPPTDR